MGFFWNLNVVSVVYGIELDISSNVSLLLMRKRLEEIDVVDQALVAKAARAIPQGQRKEAVANLPDGIADSARSAWGVAVDKDDRFAMTKEECKFLDEKGNQDEEYVSEHEPALKNAFEVAMRKILGNGHGLELRILTPYFCDSTRTLDCVFPPACVPRGDQHS